MEASFTPRLIYSREKPFVTDRIAGWLGISNAFDTVEMKKTAYPLQIEPLR
jgi:hypothetical protein